VFFFFFWSCILFFSVFFFCCLGRWVGLLFFFSWLGPDLGYRRPFFSLYAPPESDDPLNLLDFPPLMWKLSHTDASLQSAATIFPSCDNCILTIGLFCTDVSILSSYPLVA